MGTLKHHGQNSTTIALHCRNLFLHVFSRAPCTTQDVLISPWLSPGVSLCHVLSPVPSSELTGVWPGRRGMGWALSAAFPPCRAPVQVSLLSSHWISENTRRFLTFEKDVAVLGYTWPTSLKLLVLGRQTKRVRLWNDGEKVPTDRENQINLLLEKCMTVLTRWEYIREIGKNITIINSTS